jgi:hypothetical protein
VGEALAFYAFPVIAGKFFSCANTTSFQIRSVLSSLVILWQGRKINHDKKEKKEK